MLSKLQTAVPSERATQLDGQLLDLFGECADDAERIFTIDLHEHREARMALYQGDAKKYRKAAFDYFLAMDNF